MMSLLHDILQYSWDKTKADEEDEKVSDRQVHTVF